MPRWAHAPGVAMRSGLLLLVFAVGLSTYLMRLIPLALTSRSLSCSEGLPPRLRGFFAAVAPSFVAVFLVYSIVPASGGIDPLETALKLAALLPVALVYLKTRNFGSAVLAGLAVYALLYFLAR